MKRKSTSLSEKLTKYGLMSTALLAGAEFNGQIIYTDVNPDITLTQDATYDVDFNNDGIDELSVEQNFYSYSGYAQNIAAVNFYNSASFRGIQSGNFGYPFALNFSDPIGPAQTDFTDDIYGTLNYNSCNYSNSAWCGGTMDKYLGVKFNIGTNVHYGWVRLDVSADASSIIVKDFAYNNTPATVIAAGQTQSLATSDVTLSKDFIYYLDNNKELVFKSKKKIQNIQVYSAVGQLIIDKSKNDIERISLVAAKKGVYVVKLNMEGEVKSFKILIK